MKFSFIYILFFLFSFQVYAQQPDNEKKSIKIPAKETKEKDSANTKFSIKPEVKKTTPANTGVLVKEPLPKGKPKEEFSMIDNSTLLDPGEIFEKRWNKKAVEQGIMIEAMADQMLGSFSSNGKFLNIRCRDHEYPDGDLVRIFVNGDVIVPQLLLTGGFKSFDVPLTIGINEVVFLALNQGDSGPNTAQLEVYDDNGVLVSAKKWNLLTGVKATIIVTKDQ